VDLNFRIKEDLIRPSSKWKLQILSEKWRNESELTVLPQVAGHGARDNTQAILSSKDGYALKPIQASLRGERETKFYQMISSSRDPSLKQFQPFMPFFYGLCTYEERQFMAIENATKGMTKPCVLDIKIGAKTYGPDASAEKAAKQDSSYIGTRKSFGFSISGMSVYHGSKKDQIKVLDKEYGKSLNKDNVKDFVDVFFDKEKESITSETLKNVVLARLRGIQAMYSGQQIFHIFGSSILFVYDASIFQEQEPSIKAIESTVVVKMIDFAHVHPAHGKIDHNYNFGLANLISVLEGA